MKHTSPTIIACLLVFVGMAVLLPLSPVQARPTGFIRGHDSMHAAGLIAGRYSRAERGRHHRLTLDEAVRQVLRRTRGRVLDAHTRHENGRTVYVIKVLTPSGHVRIFRIDASSVEG